MDWSVGVGMGKPIIGGPGTGAFASATLDMMFNRQMYTGKTASNLTVARALQGYAEDGEGRLISFGANVPRITDRGLLVEEARTNLNRNSAFTGAVPGGADPTFWTFTTAPGVTRTVIGSGVENGIDYVDYRWQGTNSGGIAFQLFAETVNLVPAVTGQVYTSSAYIKLLGGSLTNMTAQPVNIYVSEYDAGSVFLTNSNTYCAIDGVFRRFSHTRTLNQATTAFARFIISVNAAAGATIDVTIRFGLPQFELGATATSPIRTTNASVTRPADVISLAGADFTSWFTGGVTGTFFTDYNAKTNAGASASARIVEANDTTSNNRIMLGINPSNQPRTFIDVGAVNQADIVSTVITPDTNNKLAAAFTTNDVQSCSNGVLGTQDVVASIPTPTVLFLGNTLGVTQLNGYLRRVAYFPTRLANATLQAMTA